MKGIPLQYLATGMVAGTQRPMLDKLAQLIADKTGVDWQPTSYIRDSPTHKTGDALDVAPTFRNQANHDSHAVTQGSDPLLYSRWAVLGPLMQLALDSYAFLGEYAAVVAVENDHLHLQIVKPGRGATKGRIVPFPYPKDMRERYPDSLQRAGTL